MENNAVYDRIEDLMAKADEIKIAVNEFGGMLEDIQTFTNETNVVVKDILNGRQLSEWIADLETSGAASATYADSDRMNALIADTDACKNIKIAQYLLDWAAQKNKAHVYYGSVFGQASGVNWSSLTALNSIMSNGSAFSLIAADATVFKVSCLSPTCRRSIFSNCSTTENIILASDVALGVLNSLSVTNGEMGSSSEQDVFVLKANQEYGHGTMYYKCGGSAEIWKGSFSSYGTVNKFVDRISLSKGEDVTIRLDYIYVDFS